jgi:hypothetical protein
MREPTDLTCEEYELTKVALAREDVLAEVVALLSTWIEAEWIQRSSATPRVKGRGLVVGS